MLRPSKYNIVKKSANRIIIFNTVTGKKVSGEEGDYIFELISRRGTYIDEADFKNSRKFIEDGFLVPANRDEFKEVTNIYRQILEDNVLELTIIVTDGCNFKCGYCYQEERDFIYIDGNTLNSVLKYIEKEGHKYRLVRINWFGGEPMLAFDRIIDFMERCMVICKKCKVGLVSGMTTNGYLLTSDKMNTLIKHKVFLFQITLDGSRNTHNRLRPHRYNDDSYEVIINNLKTICKHVKQYYEIVVRINLTKSIANDLSSFMEEIEFLKNNQKISMNCQKMGNYGGNSVKLLLTEMIDNDDFIFVHDSLVREGFRVSQQPVAKAGAGLCSACKPNSFYIDQKGNVLKCSLAIYDNRMSTTNRIGFIDSEGNMVIDDKLEKLWVVRDIPDRGCQTCKFYPICFNHYCPFRRLNTSKKICYGYRQATIDSI